MPLKILLIESHNILPKGLKSFFQSDRDIAHISEALNATEGVEMIRKQKPDIVLFDFSVCAEEGLETIRMIHAAFPEIKILVLSVHEQKNYLISVLDAGAGGYVLTSSGCVELLLAFQKILKGEIYIDTHFTLNFCNKYISKTPNEASGAGHVVLSDKENDVLKLVAEGYTNAEIANKLLTSVRTIETRRKNLLFKTGTSNTATLIKFAVRNGLV